jgi:hypothetical protein
MRIEGGKTDEGGSFMERMPAALTALLASALFAWSQPAAVSMQAGVEFVLKAPPAMKASHNLLIGLPVTISDTSKQYTAVILVFDADKLDWLGLGSAKPSAVLTDGSEVRASYVAFRTGWTATGGQMPMGIKVTQAIVQPIRGKQVSLTPMMALDLAEGIDFRLDEGPNFLWFLFPFESIDKVREFRFGKLSLVRKK